MPKFRAMDLEAQKSDDDEDIDESENNDDSEDESSEGSRRSKKNVKKDIKKSWFDWISDHRYIIGILIVIAIVVGVTVYFFSFRATGEAQDINTARQKLGEFGPGPPDESRGGGEAPPPRPKTPAELAAEQLSKMRATKTVHFADSAPSAFSAVAVSGPPPKVPVIPMTDSLRAEMDDDESDHRESNRTFTAAPQPVYDRPQPVQPHVDDTIYTPGALQTIVVEADATRQEDTRPQEPPAAYESYDLMF